ncbi:MAG: tRNA 2-thiouridine(34) synthase MnmA [Brooklawnia sp.]
MRVLAAMSGGVDSSVVAARLLAAGHQVTGVHLALRNSPLVQMSGTGGCSSPTDVADAHRVAQRLGIECLVWDFSDRFADDVVTYFLDEYAAGRTPNPCLRCNQRIKFAALLDRGLELGYEAVATGHYARLTDGPDGVELRRASDHAKDQSYVLGVLNQHQLRHSLFPLGDSHKPQVRAEAADLGLSVADKPDSLDLCFVSAGDTGGFLSDRLGSTPGRIIGSDGSQLGTHQGTHRYTIGQRKGLNLGVPAPDGRPRYVVGIDAASGDVTVGPAEELTVDLVSGMAPTWTGAPRLGSWTGLVQLRAHGAALPARMEASTDAVLISLAEGHRGVAPGQYAVLYDDDRVIGSTVIRGTGRSAGKGVA